MSRRTSNLTPGVAFVTGGASGLGHAIAVSFAKDGAKGVAIVDIQSEEVMEKAKKNIEAHGSKCITIRGNVTKEEEVEGAVKSTVEEFGRIDYAANFAGIIGHPLRFEDLDAEKFMNTIAVNTAGVFLCIKHEMRQMKTQVSIEVEEGAIPQRGSIVNACSVNSLMAMPGAGDYTASKHAVHGITKVAALEGREHNIRVNAVSPGFLLTPLIEGPIVKAGGAAGQALWEAFVARQGREAKFSEVGDVVVLMSSPRMSLVNAQNLFLDNGFTVNEVNF